VTTLLVEDEQRVASFVVKGLEAEGYAAEHVATGMAETVLRRSKNAFTSLLGSAQTAGLRLTYD
jgi:DNA-binding response OmpR family regulator